MEEKEGETKKSENLKDDSQEPDVSVQKDDAQGVDILGDFLKGHKELKKEKSQTEKEEASTQIQQASPDFSRVNQVRSTVGMMDRVPSGIPGFDELSGGGFKKGSKILIMGGPGTGKTIFTIQFLMQAINDGEKVAYFSFEENKEELYEDMKEFGWDLKTLEEERKFHYVHYTPEQIEGLMSEGGGTLDNFMKNIQPQRLVIDSITAFTLLGVDELKKRGNILELFEIIDSWGCTVIFTSQRSQNEEQTNSFIEFEVDSVILLYYVRKGMLGEGRERKLEILKMRGTNHKKMAVTFDIGEGITLINH